MASNQMLEALGGSGGLAQIAKELGIDQQTAMAGAAALLPAVLGGFKQQAVGQAGGLEGLLGQISQMGGGNLLDSVLSPDPTPVDQGNAIVGQIFGGGTTEAVAQQAAGGSGLSSDLLKRMLPMIVMAVAGMMAKSASAQPAGEGGITGMLGQLMGSLTGARSGQPAGLAGISQMLDLNGDGNPLDDIMGMASKLTGR